MEINKMPKNVDNEKAWIEWQYALRANDRQAAAIAFRAMQGARKEAA